MKKPFWGIVSLLALAFVLSMGATSAQAKDTIRVGLRYDPSTVNMLELKLASDIPVLLPMHTALMGPHPETGEWVNMLAESIEIVDGKDLKIN